MADFQERDLAQLRVTIGDRTKDATHDVTIELWGKLPFDSGSPKKVLDFGPFNVPAKSLVAAASSAAGQFAGMLPAPFGGVVKAVLSVASLLLA